MPFGGRGAHGILLFQWKWCSLEHLVQEIAQCSQHKEEGPVPEIMSCLLDSQDGRG